MFKLRPRDERGATITSWLNSRHSFSFAEYYDLYNMGFSDLRVINDDIVAPGTGFGLHPHNNMEIISIVLEGALEHKDSMGNSSIINRGEIQKMSAGTGIFHSEYNASEIHPVHFLQIWIIPDQKDLTPYYEQKNFNIEKHPNKLILIGSHSGRDNSVKISQDVNLYQAIINTDKVIEFDVKHTRKYWIQAAEGGIDVNSQILTAGDGLAVANEEITLKIQGLSEKSNFLIFDLRP